MPEGLSEEVMETLPLAKVGWHDGAATVTGRQARSHVALYHNLPPFANSILRRVLVLDCQGF